MLLRLFLKTTAIIVVLKKWQPRPALCPSHALTHSQRMLHSQTFGPAICQKWHETTRVTTVVRSTFSCALCLSQASKGWGKGNAFRPLAEHPRTYEGRTWEWMQEPQPSTQPVKILDRELRMLLIFPVCKPKPLLAHNYMHNFSHQQEL